MAKSDSEGRRGRLNVLRKAGAVAPSDSDEAEGRQGEPEGSGRLLRRVIEARRQRQGEGQEGAGEGRFPGLRRRLREQRGGANASASLDVSENSSVEELNQAKERIDARLERLEKALERVRDNKRKVEEWLAEKS